MASRYRSVRSLMGLIWTNIVRNQKEQAFRDYFQLSADQKVIISVGLYFERKELSILLRLLAACQSILYLVWTYTYVYDP